MNLKCISIGEYIVPVTCSSAMPGEAITVHIPFRSGEITVGGASWASFPVRNGKATIPGEALAEGCSIQYNGAIICRVINVGGRTLFCHDSDYLVLLQKRIKDLEDGYASLEQRCKDLESKVFGFKLF